MKITYNLRSLPKIAFSLILAVLVFVLISISSMALLFPASADQSADFFLHAMLFGGLISAVTFGICYYFLKNTQLIIDKTGMRTNSKLLSFHPQFATINFHSHMSLYKVENIGKTMLGRFAKLDKGLQKHDTLFAFVDRHKTPKKVFMMSNNIWEIDDIHLLENQLAQLGLTIETAQAKDFIEEFFPQMADLGKKAGHIAFGALIPLVGAMLILNYYDTWSTIYYGSFKNILWLVLFVSAAWALWYIKTNKKQLSAHIMVAGLFGMCFTMLFLAGALAMTPKLGTDLPLTFEYTKTNDFKEETWTAKENSKLKIFCTTKQLHGKSDKDKPTIAKPNIQKTTARQWFSIIRVDGKKTLCPHGRYLSDAVLPHE